MAVTEVTEAANKQEPDVRFTGPLRGTRRNPRKGTEKSNSEWWKHRNSKNARTRADPSRSQTTHSSRMGRDEQEPKKAMAPMA